MRESDILRNVESRASKIRRSRGWSSKRYVLKRHNESKGIEYQEEKVVMMEEKEEVEAAERRIEEEEEEGEEEFTVEQSRVK